MSRDTLTVSRTPLRKFVTSSTVVTGVVPLFAVP